MRAARGHWEGVASAWLSWPTRTFRAGGSAAPHRSGICTYNTLQAFVQRPGPVQRWQQRALPPRAPLACAPQLARPCSQSLGRSDGECRAGWHPCCCCSRRRHCRRQPRWRDRPCISPCSRPRTSVHLCLCSIPAAPLRAAQQQRGGAAAAAARAQRLAVRAAAAGGSAGGLQALIFDCDGGWGWSGRACAASNLCAINSVHSPLRGCPWCCSRAQPVQCASAHVHRMPRWFVT